MGDEHEQQVQVGAAVQRAEEDDAPEGVQQDETERQRGRGEEEEGRVAAQTHRARAHRVGQHVHQREGARHHAETQAAHCGEVDTVERSDMWFGS